jgi:hypothetical protein
MLVVTAILALLVLDGLAGATPHSPTSAPGGVPIAGPRGTAGGAGAASFASVHAGGTAGAPVPAAPRPAASAGGWLDLNLTTNPGALMQYAAAYDARDGYELLFGGLDSGGSYSQDTWTYQKGVWTDISSQQTTSPGARYVTPMAYDAADNETVLFGGYDGGNSTVYSDTWVFANGTWTQLHLSTHPSARWRQAMAYDATDGYVLLYGGTTPNAAPLSDTWIFSNNRWTNITTDVTGSPPARYRATMTYDATDHEIVLFGGTSSAGVNSGTSDTWTYSNLTWKHVTSGPSPPARVYSFMSYDPAASGVILYGGATSNGGTGLRDTWEFSNGTWANISSSVGTSPSWRAYGTLVYDPVGGYLVAYGGANGSSSIYYADTWSFGLSALAFASASPPATDVGITTNVSVTVLTAEKNLAYRYTGLPTGCASLNRSWVLCRPTHAGAFPVVIYANDSAGQSVSANVTVVVNPLPVITSLRFTPPSVTVGVRTRLSITGNGGTGTPTYTLPQTPPGGCSRLNNSTFACTPSAAGTFAVTASATDQVGGRANLSANLTVAPAPTRARFAASPPGIDYGQTAMLYANVTGGTAPYSYYWRSSTLPVGCAPANVSPLACKPQTLGPAAIAVTVSDRFGVSVSGTVYMNVSQDLRLVSSGISAPSVDVGMRITFYTNVTGGTSPLNYTYGGAPPGCDFTDSAAATCIPAAAGAFSIRATVTDAAGAQLATPAYDLAVAATFAFTALSVGPRAIDLGQSATITASVSNGTAPYSYSYTGLPPGCAGSVAETFACTPTAAGHYNIVVTARDSVGRSVTGNSTLLVNPALRLGAFSATPSTVASGGTVTLLVAVVAGSGSPPYSYRYSGLPTGCTGTDAPSFHCAPTSAGTFTVQVTVTDAAAMAEQASLTLNVTGSASSSGTLLGLPTAEGYGVIGAVVIVVVAAAGAVALLRRRRPRHSPPTPNDPPTE